MSLGCWPGRKHTGPRKRQLSREIPPLAILIRSRMLLLSLSRVSHCSQRTPVRQPSCDSFLSWIASWVDHRSFLTSSRVAKPLLFGGGPWRDLFARLSGHLLEVVFLPSQNCPSLVFVRWNPCSLPGAFCAIPLATARPCYALLVILSPSLQRKCTRRGAEAGHLCEAPVLSHSPPSRDLPHTPPVREKPPQLHRLPHKRPPQHGLGERTQGPTRDSRKMFPFG